MSPGGSVSISGPITAARPRGQRLSQQLTQRIGSGDGCCDRQPVLDPVALGIGEGEPFSKARRAGGMLVQLK